MIQQCEDEFRRQVSFTSVLGLFCPCTRSLLILISCHQESTQFERIFPDEELGETFASFTRSLLPLYGLF